MTKCSHCGGMLFDEYDEWGRYLLCGACAREYNLDYTSRRILFQEFSARTGLSLTDISQSGIIRL
jgi:DNA-directed RNA polymerase subunit M/transcription elongation factor TFIIS